MYYLKTKYFWEKVSILHPFKIQWGTLSMMNRRKQTQTYNKQTCAFCRSTGWLILCHILRSWLHEIITLIMTFSPGLEKNTHWSRVPTVFQEQHVCQGA